MSKYIAIVALILGQALLAAPATGAGGACTPDIAWADVPPEIRTQISQATGGEVAPEDGRFNSTDVVRDATPRARFFGACRKPTQWTVAVERGGLGYHLQVFQFSSGALTDKWTTFVPSGGFTPAALDRPDGR